MQDAKQNERSAKPPSGPHPAFVGTRESIQIKEISRGQWDLPGREVMEVNPGESSLLSTGFEADGSRATSADGTVFWRVPPLADSG